MKKKSILLITSLFILSCNQQANVNSSNKKVISESKTSNPSPSTGVSENPSPSPSVNISAPVLKESTKFDLKINSLGFKEETNSGNQDSNPQSGENLRLFPEIINNGAELNGITIKAKSKSSNLNFEGQIENITIPNGSFKINRSELKVQILSSAKSEEKLPFTLIFSNQNGEVSEIDSEIQLTNPLNNIVVTLGTLGDFSPGATSEILPFFDFTFYKEIPKIFPLNVSIKSNISKVNPQGNVTVNYKDGKPQNIGVMTVIIDETIYLNEEAALTLVVNDNNNNVKNFEKKFKIISNSPYSEPSLIFKDSKGVSVQKLKPGEEYLIIPSLRNISTKNINYTEINAKSIDQKLTLSGKAISNKETKPTYGINDENLDSNNIKLKTSSDAKSKDKLPFEININDGQKKYYYKYYVEIE